jgi:hypothetical protein
MPLPIIQNFKYISSITMAKWYYIITNINQFSTTQTMYHCSIAEYNHYIHTYMQPEKLEGHGHINLLQSNILPFWSWNL